MRKYWVDELPMFINYFRRDLKLVGVRPLSTHYFELYPRELQDLRIQVKPGLVPPYYADLPSGLEEIQESEKRYLEAYLERSEEHTSELQSRGHLVCRLLLEKKKTMPTKQQP